MDAIGMHIHGIKCDACDYKDESVKFEEYDQWVNKPCPTCGANLLTEADYQTTKFIAGLINTANQVLPPAKEDEEKVKVSVEFDGTGKVNLNIEELGT
jgi:hypothetical protein